MIVNGRDIAEEVLTELERQRALLPPVLRLGVLMMGGDAATESFVAMKERTADRLKVVVVREVLPPDATTSQALRAVERLAGACAGIVVQLPLPKGIDIEQVLNTVPPYKDADALSTSHIVEAPVASAVEKILRRVGALEGGLFGVSAKKAVVVGEGKLVGAPVAALLRKLGAEVEVVSLERGSLKSLKEADIVVSGAGSPNLIKPEMLKEGVVLIDAGTSEVGGRIAGDADPACASVASVYTPVPGGVGPVAVAMLFRNLFELAQRSVDNSVN